ncbi:hypothetical protein C8Q72DRAFT_792037 [Fomitopsis betulina]|nr:hypothetical protein C8Q72DRAFT_792037 [Fomitopsis betulina]
MSNPSSASIHPESLPHDPGNGIFLLREPEFGSAVDRARWDVMFKFAPVWPPTELPHSPQVINSQPEPTSPAGTDVTLVDDTLPSTPSDSGTESGSVIDIKTLAKKASVIAQATHPPRGYTRSDQATGQFGQMSFVQESENLPGATYHAARNQVYLLTLSMKQSPPSYLQDAGEEDIHSDFDVHVDTGSHVSWLLGAGAAQREYEKLVQAVGTSATWLPRDMITQLQKNVFPCPKNNQLAIDGRPGPSLQVTGPDYIIPRDDSYNHSANMSVRYTFIGANDKEIYVKGPGDPFLSNGLYTRGRHRSGSPEDGLIFALPDSVTAGDPHFGIFGLNFFHTMLVAMHLPAENDEQEPSTEPWSDRRQFPSSESARLRVALRLVLSIPRPPSTEGQQVSRRLVKELFFYAVLCTCGDRDVRYERGFQIRGIWVSIVCPHLPIRVGLPIGAELLLPEAEHAVERPPRGIAKTFFADILLTASRQ